MYMTRQLDFCNWLYTKLVVIRLFLKHLFFQSAPWSSSSDAKAPNTGASVSLYAKHHFFKEYAQADWTKTTRNSNGGEILTLFVFVILDVKVHHHYAGRLRCHRHRNILHLTRTTRAERPAHECHDSPESTNSFRMSTARTAGCATCTTNISFPWWEN